jgi:hypothetical protein
VRACRAPFGHNSSAITSLGRCTLMMVAPPTSSSRQTTAPSQHPGQHRALSQPPVHWGC